MSYLRLSHLKSVEKGWNCCWWPMLSMLWCLINQIHYHCFHDRVNGRNCRKLLQDIIIFFIWWCIIDLIWCYEQIQVIFMYGNIQAKLLFIAYSFCICPFYCSRIQICIISAILTVRAELSPAAKSGEDWKYCFMVYFNLPCDKLNKWCFHWNVYSIHHI